MGGYLGNPKALGQNISGPSPTRLEWAFAGLLQLECDEDRIIQFWASRLGIYADKRGSET